MKKGLYLFLGIIVFSFILSNVNNTTQNIINYSALLVLLAIVFALFVRLRQINRSLEQNIKMRTDELESQLAVLEKQLNQQKIIGAELVNAKDSAERTNRSKSNFIARVSHELRTPLNSIIGMTRIAINTDDSIKIKDCLNKTDKAAMLMLNVINDVIDISKMEADKLDVSYREFDIDKVIIDITDIITFQAEEKNQKLTINKDQNVPKVIIGDKLRLSQVLINLLSNAVKFTPKNGTIILTVEKTAEDNNELTLKFDVADTGIGISKEQQSRLFTVFQQADSDIYRKYGGTGLGLAICKQIVERMGGKIWIESDLGKGSKFIFTIKTEKGKMSYIPEQKSIHSFDNHTILIVEDVEINREIMGALLEDTGLSIDFAENGHVALSMLQDNPNKYSLVLMDIYMPVMDGLEATRMLRSLESDEAKSIPIIAMSANVLQDDINRCLESGMNDHIAKPIDAEDLFTTLNNYLI